MTINRIKYQNAILYLCRNLGGEVRGKKKLAKLLYFVDFDMYEKDAVSVTGDIYKKLPMGPFPVSLEDVTSSMVKNGKLEINQIEEREFYLPTEVYVCHTDPDLSVFNAEEIKMLDMVITKYGQLTGKQLEDLSHKEAPYVGTELKQEIPYELAFYRSTDFAGL